MTRSKLREELFKLLFRVEFNEIEEMGEQQQLFFDEEKELSEKDRAELKAKCDDILEKLETIDASLNEKITGWNTDRVGKIELTILRIAVFEIQNDENVPTSVAINEAVELAKKFGQDNASSFVNGVLAKFS